VLGGGNGSSAAAGAAGEEGEEGEDAMDEDDPLWKAFLALACGDKVKATAMLEEPDAYMHLPEITAAMAAADAAAGAAGGEDWDSDNAPMAAVLGDAAAEDVAVAVAKPAAVAKAPAKGAADDMDEEEAFVEEVEADEDPREHLNLGARPNHCRRTPAHLGTRERPLAAARRVPWLEGLGCVLVIGGGGGGVRAWGMQARPYAVGPRRLNLSHPDPLPPNVVFIGHVDAGKSTLSGNIL
jgi:hypothetical protein